MTAAIELSAPRTISLAIKGRRIDYTFAPISRQQWYEYFGLIVNSSERKGNEVVEEFDTSEARLSLVGSALQSVKGYLTDGNIESIKDWKEKLPISHRLAFADQLVAVTAREPEDLASFNLGTEAVLLTATWSAGENGVMQQFTNLRHELTSPSAEQFRRFRREISRSYIVGGSRTAKTVLRGAQKTLAELYDELIVSVEGYTLGGAALTDRSLIASTMDTYHKVAAAGKLFAPAEIAEVGAE